MHIDFRKWLEDTGQVYDRINNGPYAERGVGSKYAATDKKTPKSCPCNQPNKLFGKMNKKMKK